MLIKIIFSAFLTFVFCASPQAQDTVILRHNYYTSWFSKTERIPVLVTYTLTRKMLTCQNEVDRTENYKKDPLLPSFTNLKNSYQGSGYDRGHNMSAENNKCNLTGMTECYYYSNMTPQLHSFNAGKWKSLENKERATARVLKKVIVTIGSFGIFSKIGSDSIVVPKFMWKVIYTPSTNVYLCYLFPNTHASGSLESYLVSLDEIKNLGNVDFADGIVNRSH